jgi:hypothetical protein
LLLLPLSLLPAVFSKTNDFVVSCGGFQKARKQAEKALFL